MPHRRKFLQTLSALPAAAALAAPGAASAKPITRDVIRELGIRPFINAAGTYTDMTASLMHPEAVEAIRQASTKFVMLDELHDAVGRRIAELLQAESAMVTAGAASALTLGTAGVLTGTDQQKISQLPDLEGMKSEVIMLKSHRFGYDRALRNCGVRIVEVENEGELDSAVNPKTAMMLFFNDATSRGPIGPEDFVRLGQKHSVPTFNDCAADVPPAENLTRFTRMGFDLVTFSGGKGLRGPQSAGLLAGRKDLIEAARKNAPPNGGAIGRGMKVNKEEMVGMLVALETFLKRDHAADMREWEQRAERIRKAAVSVPGVQAEIFVPEIANHVPHLRITWDFEGVGPVNSVVKALRDGEPSIGVRQGKEALLMSVWMMQPGEDKIVAKRLREVLAERSKA